MEVRSVTVGKERFSYVDRELTLPANIVRGLAKTLHEWTAVSPFEPTYARERFGVPSLIVRFDGVVENGEFRSYEIQAGCGWIGYCGIANSEFKKVRDRMRTECWPQFKLLMPIAHPAHDDELWLERTTIEEASKSAEPLMIRRWLFSEFNDTERKSLLGRSVKPMFYQNDKAYGTALGWWRRVVWTGSDSDLPWDEGFVLKPVRGHGSSDIMIWNPESRRGRATKTQILETFQQYRSMYLQPFIPPMQMKINDRDYNGMLRPYFGYDPHRKEWVPMHGVWTARPEPNLRLHGSSDAISGPLRMD